MLKRKYRIAHLTTVHPRNDTRIYYKECISLSVYFDVSLVVADGKGEEIREGIHIYDIGIRSASRVKRMVWDTRKMFRKAWQLDCDLYHFHDPELMFVGLKLMRRGKKVIYDIHEEVPDQILSKPYLSVPIKKLVSWTYRHLEGYVCNRLSGLVTATPHIKERLKNLNPIIEDIKNYPLVKMVQKKVNRSIDNSICYVGVIAEHRGILKILDALPENVKLLLAGRFEDEKIKIACYHHKHWKHVVYLGVVDSSKVMDILLRSKVGLVVLQKLKRYEYSLPVKMFEYMLAGLPVIASDIPFWCKIINESDCGICVDPGNTEEIKQAVLRLLSDVQYAERLGRNGQVVVRKKYNWKKEEKKLFDFYERILGVS